MKSKMTDTSISFDHGLTYKQAILCKDKESNDTNLCEEYSAFIETSRKENVVAIISTSLGLRDRKCAKTS